MKLKAVLFLSATGFAMTIGQANAGPIMKMIEEKKAQQATSPSSTNAPAQPQQQAPAAAPTNANSKFDTAKLKCKELGNKEGSDKFNSCVMTLME